MTSSNHSNPSNQRPTLQVVPPTALKPTPQPVTPTPKTIPNVATTSSSFSLIHTLLKIGVIAGIGALGFIPVSQTVDGKSEVTVDPAARQIVNMKIPGIVKILRRHNDLVQIGDPLALIKSKEVDKDIAEAKKQSEQFEYEVASIQLQPNVMEASVEEALAKQTVIHNRVEFLQQQLTQLSKGSLPPQFQELQSQQAVINSDILALQANLDMITIRLKRYQEAIKAQAISLNQVEELEQQKNSLLQQIQGKQHQREAKNYQMDIFKQNLQQELSQKQAEENQVVKSVQTAQQHLQQAKSNVQNRQKLAKPRAEELSRVQERKEDLVVRAEKAGTIVSVDLDKKENLFMSAGSPILEIVDLKKLMLKVQIKSEDRQLVSIGKIVTFRPQGNGFSSYKGAVIKIDSVVSSEGLQPTNTITVYVSFNQTYNSLLPGLPGHAHIEVDSMLLYQKIQREFEKSVPIDKFL